MSGVIEHAVPSYVPEARGQITHYVCYDAPLERGCAVTMSTEVPCTSQGEAARIALANKRLGMRNIRTLTAAEKRGEPVQLPQAVRS